MQISIAAARKNANLNQKEAAKQIGVSVSTLKNWEASKSFPRQPMIEKMCEIYGCCYDDLNFSPID